MYLCLHLALQKEKNVFYNHVKVTVTYHLSFWPLCPKRHEGNKPHSWRWLWWAASLPTLSPAQTPVAIVTLRLNAHLWVVFLHRSLQNSVIVDVFICIGGAHVAMLVSNKRYNLLSRPSCCGDLAVPARGMPSLLLLSLSWRHTAAVKDSEHSWVSQESFWQTLGQIDPI